MARKHHDDAASFHAANHEYVCGAMVHFRVALTRTTRATPQS